MGALPNVYTNYQSANDVEQQEKVSVAWGVKVPTNEGMTYPKMLRAVKEGNVRSMYMIGSDIAHTDPNNLFVQDALSQLELLIVQDIFMTESAKLAHVILPAATFLESNGTYTNGERRIQRIRKALEPPGQAKEDWLIVAELAEVMGRPIVSSRDVSDIWDEMAALTPNFAGINYDRLDRPESIQWPAPDPGHPGTKVMHTSRFNRGLGQFAAPNFAEPNERTSDDYPFIMVTGRHLFHYNAATQTRRTLLTEFSSTDYLEIHPDDAAEIGIDDGSDVWLSSPRNKIKMVAKHSVSLRRGNLFTTFHFPELGLNGVLSSSADGLTGCPEFKVQAVNVEPVK
jgi:predicted molibdopterin-dependent oxidoreductase YjgC